MIKQLFHVYLNCYILRRYTPKLRTGKGQSCSEIYENSERPDLRLNYHILATRAWVQSPRYAIRQQTPGQAIACYM